MDRSTGSLVAASDGHSGLVGRYKTIGTAPVVIPMRQTSGTGAGPTLNHHEGADMAKRTRGPDPSDRLTRFSGVKITPPTLAGPVTTTPAVA
ncbi:hypothetical protein GCM10022295_86070 [Streptomyces osmaniensis]|uniref:Uncharacterized protein n=1 Tax=Streptomyces osmaniensis TaxID=593134 RepID=A0ABP6YTY9_9ACTN